MTADQLYENIKRKGSFLCVGLDSDIDKIPAHLKACEDPVFEFNKAIIDATADFAVCYKPNTAFYEKNGVSGWLTLEKTVAYIRNTQPDIFIIADAKRGDIGNTSKMYAQAFFEQCGVDAVTLSPYMGYDTAEPFFKYENHWAVLLALTSNGSASDFETLTLDDGQKLYEQVLRTASNWGTTDNTMFVVGATKADMLEGIRKIIPDHFLLVPGVGAQGGSLEEVVRYGMNSRCGLLVNSSRGIIYASSGENFAAAAREQAKALRDQMATYL